MDSNRHWDAVGEKEVVEKTGVAVARAAPNFLYNWTQIKPAHNCTFAEMEALVEHIMFVFQNGMGVAFFREILTGLSYGIFAVAMGYFI